MHANYNCGMWKRLAMQVCFGAVFRIGLADYSIFCQEVITVFMILFGVNFNFYYVLLGIITFDIKSSFESVWPAFHHAAFQVGSVITTTGYATTDFNLWSQMSKTVLVLIMFIGACAGSTGGGIKVSRILIIFKTIQSSGKRCRCIFEVGVYF